MTEEKQRKSHILLCVTAMRRDEKDEEDRETKQSSAAHLTARPPITSPQTKVYS